MGKSKNSYNIKILMAEDDKFLSKVMVDKFKREGYKITPVSDGNKVMEKIREEKPNIILLDLIMPGKDGFEILSELKLDKVFKKIPVVIMSNLGQDSDIEEAKKLGADDYLVKSNYAINDIVKKIKEVLARKR